MSKMSVTKVTLSSKKVVLLRELKISHTETAAQLASPRANGDSQVLQILMQKELVKLVLYKVDGKDVTPAEKENMDSLFSYSEYSQVLQVMGKLMGADDVGKSPKIELMTDTSDPAKEA
jgi:hypothetical protein